MRLIINPKTNGGEYIPASNTIRITAPDAFLLAHEIAHAILKHKRSSSPTRILTQELLAMGFAYHWNPEFTPETVSGPLRFSDIDYYKRLCKSLLYETISEEEAQVTLWQLHPNGQPPLDKSAKSR